MKMKLKLIYCAMMSVGIAAGAAAEDKRPLTFSFDTDKPGEPPKGFEIARTGQLGMQMKHRVHLGLANRVEMHEVTMIRQEVVVRAASPFAVRVAALPDVDVGFTLRS